MTHGKVVSKKQNSNPQTWLTNTHTGACLQLLEDVDQGWAIFFVRGPYYIFIFVSRATLQSKKLLSS